MTLGVEKRPLLPAETRAQLARMSMHAHAHSDSPERAYVRGVRDVLNWLCGEDMSDLLREVTR